MIDYTRNNIEADSERYPSELSIFNGVVRTVNDVSPDDTGNVEVVTGELSENEDGSVKITIGETSKDVESKLNADLSETRLRNGYQSEPNGYNNFLRNLETGELYASNGFYTTKLISLPQNIDLRVAITSAFNTNNRIIFLDKDKKITRNLMPELSNKFYAVNSNEVYCYVSLKDLPTQNKDILFKRTTGTTADEVLFTVDNGSHIDGLIDKQSKLTAVAPIVIDDNNNIKYQP